VSNLWHQNVQNRKELIPSPKVELPFKDGTLDMAVGQETFSLPDLLASDCLFKLRGFGGQTSGLPALHTTFNKGNIGEAHVLE